KIILSAESKSAIQCLGGNEAARDAKRLLNFAALIGGWFCETYKDYCFCYMSASVETITGVKPEWH
ncbi:MAG: hypothetical protein VXW49_10215, partial [Pseudomonadota bacterium]|nr:hypothetical protein [Pseudomonadota bacterium]